LKDGYKAQVSEWKEISKIAKQQKTEAASLLSALSAHREKISSKLEELLVRSVKCLENTGSSTASLNSYNETTIGLLKSMEQSVSVLGNTLITVETTVQGIGESVDETVRSVGSTASSQIREAGESAASNLTDFGDGLKALSENILVLIQIAERLKLTAKPSVKQRFSKLAFWRKNAK
jgi:ribonuclease D